MSGTRETPEGVYGESYPQDLRDMAKAERLEARFQGHNTGPLITTPMQGQRRQAIGMFDDLDASVSSSLTRVPSDRWTPGR